MQARIRHSENMRRLAAECYRKAQYCQATAGRLLRAKCGEMAPEHAGEFCKQCYNRMREQGNQKDRPRPGCPRKVPDQMARDLANLLRKGRGKGQFFESIDEALASNPALKEQFSKLGVTNGTITRAVLRANPRLVQRRVAVKPIPRQAYKRQWVEAARGGSKMKGAKKGRK